MMPGIFDALIQQESGGRAGVVGPKTKWGHALGLTQMLPATAQEMARKIGVPYNQQMMTDKSPKGAAYQRQLGEAYFNEGLERTGNERDALRYYHGGPNRAQWGPKTNQYADSVLARAGGQPMIKPRKPQAAGIVQSQPTPTTFEEASAAMLNDGGMMNARSPLAPMPAEFRELDPGNMQLPGVSPEVAALGRLQPAKAKKGGIFGSGLTGWDVVGAAADGYLMANGQQGAYLPALRAKREMEFDREKFNQQLEAKRADDEARRIADANKPIRHTNSAGDMVEIGPDGNQRVLYADPFGKQQYQRVENPVTGGIEIINNGATSRPSPQHLQHLMQTGDKQNFDAKFGRGMADYYLNQGGR